MLTCADGKLGEGVNAPIWHRGPRPGQPAMVADKSGSEQRGNALTRSAVGRKEEEE